MMTLFRMVEPCGGAIYIDGLDTSKIGLTDLRSRLSLVPQDPVIFSGSVRSNLDPFGQAPSDVVIWEALRQAGIDELVRSLGVSRHAAERVDPRLWFAWMSLLHGASHVYQGSWMGTAAASPK
jgi:ABC-type multidrug transport system fused ATPase/permease subunit